MSPQAIRARGLRRVLAGILITIGAVSFVEVVLVPGMMIRRNLGPIATTSTTEAPAAEESHEIRLPFGLLTDEQKARQRQQQLDRIEQKLRSTHQRLGNATIALKKERAAIAQYAESKLRVGLDDQSTVPPGLRNRRAQPTAKTAWSHLVRIPAVVDAQLREAGELLDLVAARFAAGSFLPDDDRDMQAAIQQVDKLRLAVNQSRVFVDHLVILQRARASLARQEALESNQGGSP